MSYRVVLHTRGNVGKGQLRCNGCSRYRTYAYEVALCYPVIYGGTHRGNTLSDTITQPVASHTVSCILLPGLKENYYFSGKVAYQILLVTPDRMLSA